jgi:ABC-2 type transport system permease protein
MSARQVSLVAWREIVSRGATRAYQVSTALLVILAVAGVVVVSVLPGFFDEDPLRVGLVPETAHLASALDQAGGAMGRDVESVVFASRPAADGALDAGAVDVVLLGGERLMFPGEAPGVLVALVQQALFFESLEARAAEVGITVQQVQSLLAPVPVEIEVLRGAPGVADGAGEVPPVGQGIGALSAIVLLMALSFYGQWVLVGVIEEKSNRVAEVLLASVAPVDLLVGKVAGILLLGVGQMLLGVLAGVGAWVVVQGADALPAVALAGVGMGVLWLVLGLLLYNFAYAAIGATVNRPEEATSVSLPVLIPLMAGYFVGLIVIPSNPDALLARMLSLFPFTAPLTMPSRVASGGASAAEGVLAVALAVLAIAGTVWLASRIYAGGILQTTKVGLLAAYRRSRE